MILFIDNYDSFTYNLVDLLGQLNPDLMVVRNDQITIPEIQSLQPAGIIISPGPGNPADAGISCQLIRHFYDRIPILGVCLGHQCIGEVFGARIVRAPQPVHGKTSRIYHNQRGLFQNIPSPFTATRYHSLIVEKNSLPESLTAIAFTKDNLIMALRHRQYPVYGVQFHPESILTPVGHRILKNWLEEVRTIENTKTVQNTQE